MLVAVHRMTTIRNTKINEYLSGDKFNLIGKTERTSQLHVLNYC